MLIRNEKDIEKVIQSIPKCVGRANISEIIEKKISGDGRIPIVRYIEVAIRYKDHTITISAKKINRFEDFINTIISEIDGSYNEVVKILVGPTFANNPNIKGKFSCTEKNLTKIFNYL